MGLWLSSTYSPDAHKAPVPSPVLPNERVYTHTCIQNWLEQSISALLRILVFKFVRNLDYSVFRVWGELVFVFVSFLTRRQGSELTS